MAERLPPGGIGVEVNAGVGISGGPGLEHEVEALDGRRPALPESEVKVGWSLVGDLDPKSAILKRKVLRVAADLPLAELGIGDEGRPLGTRAGVTQIDPGIIQRVFHDKITESDLTIGDRGTQDEMGGLGDGTAHPMVGARTTDPKLAQDLRHQKSEALPLAILGLSGDRRRFGPRLVIHHAAGQDICTDCGTHDWHLPPLIRIGRGGIEHDASAGL